MATKQKTGKVAKAKESTGSITFEGEQALKLVSSLESLAQSTAGLLQARTLWMSTLERWASLGLELVTPEKQLLKDAVKFAVKRYRDRLASVLGLSESERKREIQEAVQKAVDQALAKERQRRFDNRVRQAQQSQQPQQGKEPFNADGKAQTLQQRPQPRPQNKPRHGVGAGPLKHNPFAGLKDRIADDTTPVEASPEPVTEEAASVETPVEGTPAQ